MSHSSHGPSPTGRFAFVFKVALARSAKAEAIYFPTLHVVPPSTKAFGPTDVQLTEHASALCMEALRKIDPEIGAMSATPAGGPAFSVHEGPADTEPALRKNGWEVHIEWNPRA